MSVGAHRLTGEPYRAGSGKWQATRWPGASSFSGGSTVWQISCAFQHRVWNRHPGGGFSGLGTSPVSRIRSRRTRAPAAPAGTGSGTGTADISATVYGCLGLAYRESRSAVSTI